MAREWAPLRLHPHKRNSYTLDSRRQLPFPNVVSSRIYNGASVRLLSRYEKPARLGVDGFIVSKRTTQWLRTILVSRLTTRARDRWRPRTYTRRDTRVRTSSLVHVVFSAHVFVRDATRHCYRRESLSRPLLVNLLSFQETCENVRFFHCCVNNVWLDKEL